MGRLKREFLIEHGFHEADVFIETGTDSGVRLARICDLYPTVHTIELDPQRFFNATQRLAPFAHVRCHLGNSKDVLPSILDTNQKTVIYLDAHTDGVGDDRPPQTDIVLEELAAILSLRWWAPLVILIDDAEKFSDRYWKLDASRHHNREYWPRDREVMETLDRFDCEPRVIRQSKSDIWVIDRHWVYKNVLT